MKRVENIKLFQLVTSWYQTMSVYSPQSNHQVHSINRNFLFFTLSIALNFSSTFAYFLLKANTIEDYGITFYTSMAGLCALADVLIIFWQTPTILRLIENCEQFIEKSEKNPKNYSNFHICNYELFE